MDRTYLVLCEQKPLFSMFHVMSSFCVIVAAPIHPGMLSRTRVDRDSEEIVEKSDDAKEKLDKQTQFISQRMIHSETLRSVCCFTFCS